MRIRSLHLTQFRSYPSLEASFERGSTHVLLGSNGAGKTNILEAINVLCEAESFLGVEDCDLVQWGEHYYRVRASIVSDQGDEMALEVVSEIVPRKRRAFLRNDVRISHDEFNALLPTLLFLPQDLALFSGSPALRRKLLDRILSQVSPLYRGSLATYQKVMKQRNALLRHIARGDAAREDLNTWNVILAHEGARITVRRLELLEVFQCTFREELARLGETWHHALLSYERVGTARSEQGIEGEILAEMERVAERDVLLQSTSVGPHRDDWTVLVSDRRIETFASRGQQRTAVLALLFLQGSYLELQRGEKPVLLLDDVFSELDERHEEALLSSFDDHQVFISATHLPETLGSATVWDVRDGNLNQRLAVGSSL